MTNRLLPTLLVATLAVAGCGASDDGDATPVEAQRTDTAPSTDRIEQPVEETEQLADDPTQVAVEVELTPVTDDIVDICSFIPVELVEDIRDEEVTDVKESFFRTTMATVRCNYDVDDGRGLFLTIVDQERWEIDTGEPFEYFPGVPTEDDYVVSQLSENTLITTIGQFRIELVSFGEYDRTRLPELMTEAVQSLAALGAGSEG